jgi:hypothetical protein
VACGVSLGDAKFEQSVQQLKNVAAKLQDLTAPKKTFYSFNGCGTMLLDYRALSDGTYQAVRWVTVFGLPIIPLSAYVIEPQSQEYSHGSETSRFNLIGKSSLSMARILRTYGLVVIGLLPFVVGAWNSSFLNRRLGGPLAFLMMLLAIAWSIYVIFFRIKNDRKAYKRNSIT